MCKRNHCCWVKVPGNWIETARLASVWGRPGKGSGRNPNIRDLNDPQDSRETRVNLIKILSLGNATWGKNENVANVKAKWKRYQNAHKPKGVEAADNKGGEVFAGAGGGRRN